MIYQERTTRYIFIKFVEKAEIRIIAFASINGFQFFFKFFSLYLKNYHTLAIDL